MGRNSVVCVLGFIAIAALAGIFYNELFSERIGGLFINEIVNSCAIMKKNVITRLGPKSYLQLFQQLYSELNYSVRYSADDCSAPILKLHANSPKSCDQVFQEWLHINEKSTDAVPRKPARKIPQELVQDYLLKGFVQEKSLYFNDAQFLENDVAKPYEWTKSTVKHYVQATREKKWRNLGYGNDSEALYNALQRYKPSGKGLVIGSIRPWVEAMCLYFGSDSLTTVEYHPIHSTHPAISSLKPIEMAHKWRDYHHQFDFAATFSSLEHSGLGRFGDLLDPSGDLREMQKTACLVKPSGLIYLAFAVGSDALYWNAHRVYGMVRWPLMAAGWTLEAVFEPHLPFQTMRPLNLSIKAFETGAKQVVAVLRNNK